MALHRKLIMHYEVFGLWDDVESELICTVKLEYRADLHKAPWAVLDSDIDVIASYPIRSEAEQAVNAILAQKWEEYAKP